MAATTLNPRIATCYKNLVVCAAVDGEMSPEERQLLSVLAERLGILPEEAEALEREAVAAGSSLDLPPREEDRLVLLKTAIAIACADRRLSAQERKLIRHLQRRLEVPDEEILPLLPEPIRATFRPDEDRRRGYRLLAAAARVDGEVHEAERRVLDRAATLLGLPADEAATIMAETERATSVSLLLPEDPVMARQVVLFLRSLVLADGRLDPREASLLGRVARKAKVDLASLVEEEAQAIEDATAEIGDAAIRVVARGIFRREGKILVQGGIDEAKGERFFLLPGGAVEFGELAAAALAREVQEEMGYAAQVGARIGCIENLFVFEEQPGHEIVLVFEATFATDDPYRKAVIPGREGGLPFLWMPLTEFARADDPKTLYPAGTLGLLSPAIARG